ALAYFDGRTGYAEADALSDSLAGHLAARGAHAAPRAPVRERPVPAAYFGRTSPRRRHAGLRGTYSG
ncbi:hypothetical protein, partial [Streptomyces sp. NPDC048551]|uniref:hypothetical protein n=1 Tax=Streptomyces sp. NPDC048551 TaxID=3155758 RepID=UPI0034354F17